MSIQIGNQRKIHVIFCDLTFKNSKIKSLLQWHAKTQLLIFLQLFIKNYIPGDT